MRELEEARVILNRLMVVFIVVLCIFVSTVFEGFNDAWFGLGAGGGRPVSVVLVWLWLCGDRQVLPKDQKK